MGPGAPQSDAGASAAASPPLSIEYKPDLRCPSRSPPSSSSSAAAATKRPRVALNLGRGVMRDLFERINAPQILERIFFWLDPPSLKACSAVCRSWRSFLDSRVWRLPDGRERIRANWLRAVPTAERVETTLGVAAPHARFVPRDIVADGELAVVASLADLVAFHRRASGDDPQRTRTLLTSTKSKRWQLQLTKRFLLARQRFRGSPLEIFDREDDLSRFTVSGAEWFLLSDVTAIDDDSFLAVFAATTSSVSSVARCRIVREEKSCLVEWRAPLSAELLAVGGQGLNVAAVTCWKTPDAYSLSLHDLNSWRPTSSVRLPLPAEAFAAKGLAYSRDVAAAVFAPTQEVDDGQGWVSFAEEGPNEVLLCDTVMRVVVRRLQVDLSAHLRTKRLSPLRLWCDPPAGTLLLTTADLSSGLVLVWDMDGLLRETRDGDTVTPDGVVETGPAVDAGSIHVNNQTMLFATIDSGTCETTLLELDFWGR